MGIAERSMAVRLARTLWGRSGLATPLTRLARSLSVPSSWVGARLARHPASREFAGAIRIAQDSALFSAVDRLWVGLARARRHSATTRVVDRLLTPLERWQRVRVVGWIVVVAMLVHAILSVDTLLRNWRSATVWLVLSVSGVALVAACRPMAAAWAHWRWRPRSRSVGALITAAGMTRPNTPEGPEGFRGSVAPAAKTGDPPPVSPRPARRVVRVITRLNIGGPAIQAASLVQRLKPFGYQTLLMYGRLAPGEGDMRYLLPSDDTREVVPTMSRSLAPLQDARAFWQIYRTICRVRPDVVHTHTAKAGAVGRLAAIAYNHTVGRRRPARLVHTYHGHVFDGYFGSVSTRIFLAIERWLARRTEVLVAISERVRDDLIETYRIAHAGQIRVIRLGFDLSPFVAIDGSARERARSALGIPGDRTIVTTVGRLTEIKRHSLFLEMAALVANRRPDVAFQIVGDGELRGHLEALAGKLGIGERVTFLGWRTDLATIYGATDVFVLTSRNEGTPVALIEAMASGVVGVSTNVGGVSDVVLGPDIGTLVPFGSPEALANAVLELLTSPSRHRAMGEKAREAVRSRFHVDRLVRDIVGLYDELADAPHRRRRSKIPSTNSPNDV